MLSQRVLKSVVLGCFALVCCGGQFALAQDANMEKAMTAAFGSKEIKKLKIKGHEFNVKPVSTTNNGGTVTVKGQISHHLTLRDDDQVYYSFTVRADGTVESFDVNIEKSLMNRALTFAWNELKSLLKEKALGSGSDTGSTEQALGLSNELEALEKAIKLAEGKIGTGGWEKSAAAIIANVMIRANATTSARGVRVYDRVVYLRRAVERAQARPSGGVSRVTGGVFNTNGGTLNNSGSRPQVRDHRNR